jgi:hypothetical protein
MCKKIPIDERYRVRGAPLLDVLERDRKDGRIPFYVYAYIYIGFYKLK